MSVITSFKQILGKGRIVKKNSSDAYDLWADAYDDQPGNLMLDLDEIIFEKLFAGINVKGKMIADIGCGTGRHWQKILNKSPTRLVGFDVSAGMLSKLKQKFPGAETFLINNDAPSGIPDTAFDVIISTLTVAHISNIESALNTWCRILKNNAEVIITDFHPQLLAQGGKRTFNHDQHRISIKNYVHPVFKIKEFFYKNGFILVAEEERIIDDAVKKYYADQNALHVFNKFKGSPVIYGLHLKRSDADK